MNTVYNILNNKPGAGLLPMQLSSIGKHGYGSLFTSKGIFRVTTNSNGTLNITQVRVQRRAK